MRQLDRMTHRERVVAALERQPTDRVPIAMVCSGINPPVYRELQTALLARSGVPVEAWLDPMLDIRSVGPRYVGPPPAPGEDIWGVVRAPVSYGSGAYDEIVRHPLATARIAGDLVRHRWPSTDWFDYGTLEEEICRGQADGDRCLMIGGGNPFETAWYLRGFERTLEDLAVDPSLVHDLMQRVTGFFLAHLRRQLEAAHGRVDLVFTADDIGGQNGWLMSPDHWRQQIRPFHEALNALVHEFGARVIYHSDGAIMAAAPELAEMGVDVLQALQFDARGMDPARLKREVGERMGFQGGVSVQSTLPFGTPEAVRAEVRDRIAVLGAGGGYILGPSHAIQAGTPAANVIAMFDEAARFVV